MERYRFLGIEIDAFTIETINQKIDEIIKKEKKKLIANHNLHSIYLYHKDDDLKKFYQKTEYNHADGMSLVLLGKLFGCGLSRENRVTYVDWIYPLMSLAEKENWKVMFIGSKPGVGEIAVGKIQKKFPNLKMQSHHGYFDRTTRSTENKDVLKRIEAFQPQILLVGMGMPIQEEWIYKNYDDISANVILPCGACMDYIAEQIPTPPRWIGKIGLEWCYRLLSEPKRLWKRYLVEPWFILWLVVRELFKKA